MCGRYTLTTPAHVLAEYLGLPDAVPRFKPRYNVAPTQEVPVVRQAEPGDRRFALLRWGLIPHWAEGPESQWINARAETVSTKPAFRDSFRSRRCLVLADGFYEWKRQGKGKQPFYLRLKDHAPFAMAGLWARWRPPSEEVVESCAVITTRPNSLVATLHDRMPAILERHDIDRWLDPNVETLQSLLELLRPYSAQAMESHPVRTLVNRTANDGPELIEPDSPLPQQMGLFD